MQQLPLIIQIWYNKYCTFSNQYIFEKKGKSLLSTKKLNNKTINSYDIVKTVKVFNLSK